MREFHDALRLSGHEEICARHRRLSRNRPGIALRLAERGISVAVNYLQDCAAATETVRRARACGVKALPVQADVSRPDEVRRMTDEVEEGVRRP